jgi:hypothetical protein
MMVKYVITALLFIVLLSCKDKGKKKLSGSDQIQANEFFGVYDPLKLPFAVTDTTMNKLADTSTIDYSIFTRFVPDTIFINPFGKDRKLTIHPIGKIEVKGKETYLASYVASKKQSAIYLSVFNKEKFTVNMPLLISNSDSAVDAATIDKKLSIVLNKEWTQKNDYLYRRTIYAYNNIGVFTTILTETNEERSNAQTIINPLDTFPKRNKFSGDYLNGKKKFLSIRDGKSAGEYLFFVHFENNNEEEECGGELKGRFNISADNKGVYSQTGDPCGIEFTLSATEVQVKENGSCGNYRGIKCFFNDTYSRKKEPKPATNKATRKRNETR